MTPQDRREFMEDLAAIVHASPSILTADERQWVRLAIKREAQSFELRKAIIEKTLVGLVWMLCVGLGYALLDFLKMHGWK